MNSSEVFEQEVLEETQLESDSTPSGSEESSFLSDGQSRAGFSEEKSTPFNEEKYAIIRAKGKQFIVREGVSFVTDRINVEEGQLVSFDDVLLVKEGDKISVGTDDRPLANANISGTVVRHFRGKKLISYKKRRRHGYERKVGHRQDLTMIMINSIR